MRVLAVAAVVLGLSTSVALGGSGSLHARLAGTFRVPGVESTSSTAMVVELPTGRVVFARNPDLSLEPASNEKLSITYASMVELGPSYRWPTEVLGEGRRVGSTWQGPADPEGLRRSDPDDAPT